LREAKYEAGLERGRPFLRITGPDRLVEHGEVNLHNLPGTLARKILRNPASRLTRMDVVPRIEQNFIEPLLKDLLLQNWVSLTFDTRYLTDRAADFEVLDSINHPENRRQNASLANALSHSLPVILTMTPAEMLHLRQNEGEAFQVYRDAIHSLLNTLNPSDERAVKAAFLDVVRPQLNKIDLAVSEARKTVSSSLREKLVFGTGLVTISLFSGLLPPEVGAVVGWLGGAKFGTDLLIEANKLVQEPRAIRSTEFYFLWRLDHDRRGRSVPKRHR
jgi:hypothetical protein